MPRIVSTALTVEGSDELSDLMIQTNDMFARTTEFEVSLQQAKNNAEQANRAKSEFLRNMSHEFRTSLNHILSFTQLIRDEKADSITGTQAEYLDDVLTSSTHLFSMINDLLDLARIESGKPDMILEEVNLSEQLHGTVQIFQAGHDKGQPMVVLQIGTLAQNIIADRRKIDQILYNLLSNAVKFTPSDGKITVSADTNTNRHEIVVSVKDTGTGLEAKSFDLIFEAFGRVEDVARNGTEGTDLELPAIFRKPIDIFRRVQKLSGRLAR